MNLILCGLPKCGKTTVGQLLAEKIGWNFIDTDWLIKTNEGMTSRELYLNEGEKGFRAIEKQTIFSLVAYQNSVIATGGGSILDRDNRLFLKGIGKVIYLKTSTIAWERFQPVPLYLDGDNLEKSFSELVQRRIPLYEEIADVVVDITHKSLETIVDLILKEKYGQ